MKTIAQMGMFFLILAVAAFGLFACDRSDRVQAAREERTDDVPALAERDFLTRSGQGHHAEVHLSGMALSSSRNAEVRDFANMIDKDHREAMTLLSGVMRENNLPMPEAVSEETKVDMERLTALSGAEFDREYVNLMVASHQKTLSMLRDQMNTSQNEDVRDYAEKLMPKVEMHLQKAQTLQSKLFGGGAS